MALITVKSSKKKLNTAQSALQKKFERLTKSLEREQRSFTTFQADMERLRLSYVSDVLPVMKESCVPLEALAERLIELSGRKSLSKWHREEIDHWLSEIFELIAAVDRNKAAELAEKAMAVFYQLSGYSEDDIARAEKEDEEQLRAFEERLREMMEKQFREDFPGEEIWDEDEDEGGEDFFGFTEDEKKRKTQSKAKHQNTGSRSDQEQASQADKSASITDDARHQDVDKWLSKLFRKAAQALHPDREPDPAKRAAKQEAMSELLAAREAGDIIHILTVYTEHVQQGPAEVPEEMLEALCDNLADKIEAIEYQKEDFLHDDPVMMFIYDALYDKQKKQQQKNIELQQEQARNLAKVATEDREYMRNLKCLKEILAERYDNRAIVSMDDIFRRIL